MNQHEIGHLVSQYASGNISKDEHAELSSELMQNADSRRLFFELVDLEFGLARCTNEIAETELLNDCNSPSTTTNILPTSVVSALAIAASLIAISAFVWWTYFMSHTNDFANESGEPSSLRTEWNGVGSIRQTNCTWEQMPSSPSEGRFANGKYRLKSGVAEFAFNSGTTLTFEGPCELNVDSNSSAELEAGSIVVNVSEISDGFMVKTAYVCVVNDGSEYAVSVDNDKAEIHVFDGSVVWQPIGANDSDFERIEAGQAARFSRQNANVGKRIPFGQRQFIRSLEAKRQADSKGKLVAYDGFENLAGRIRSGRSGFGWSGGWQPPGRRRGNGKIVPSPPGVVFGHDRTDLRMLELGNGNTIQRDLEAALLNEHPTAYVSFVLYRNFSFGKQSSFQFSICDSSKGRPVRRRFTGIGFGITSDGFPFVKNGGVIDKVATRITNNCMFCVAKIVRIDDFSCLVQFRVFLEDEYISLEPSSWTVSSNHPLNKIEMNRVQMSSGKNGEWRIDELRIGHNWQAILNK